MDTVVACEAVKRSFGATERNVLDGVTLGISPGEFVAVMGPSGSGKSTLLFALSGMDRVNSGTVTFEGTDLTRLSENELADIRRQRMGFVFQQPTLLRHLDILDNVVLPAISDARISRRRVAEKARELMRRMGISDLEDRHITQASGGQLQRVGICLALIHDPAVIFGDEPTGALDSTAAAEIMELLNEIHRAGTTIILVTHDPGVAARTERVLYLFDGRLAGEFLLGPFDGTEAALGTREEQLIAWLAERTPHHLMTHEKEARGAVETR
ncbi:MAG: ABC transporter ATP-binding protein [Spirochaeta sp.]|nr:ABC transporter ATP-binding protein [Spirochaeta sp.]